VDYRAHALSLRALPANIAFMSSVDLSELSSVLLGQKAIPGLVGIARIMAAVHYIVAKAESAKLGHVKLNRILWYSDLEHYRWRGASITGLQQYSRTLQGPMSNEISRAVGRLVKERKVAERPVKIANFVRREMVSLELPVIDALNHEQTDILAQIIQIIAPLTATQLMQAIHDDRLWQQVSNGEPMPVATGSIVTRPLRVAMAA
jgi:hypothetical protein